MVIHDGYQNIRSEPRFNLLWLNPPYQEGFSERAELTFLRALTSAKQGVLMKGGILLFCIPQYILKDTAGVLSGRFQDLTVYRFTDANYDVFKQVVVIGRLGRGPAAEQKLKYKRLVAIGEGQPDLIPTLDEMEPFTVFPSDDPEKPMFRAGVMNEAELADDLTTSTLITDVFKRLVPKSGVVSMKRPMLPLKPAHMGIAIAAGAVGGNMGSHIISGVTKQRTDVEDIIDDETGKVKGERITKHFISVVRAFTPDGVVDLK